MTSQVDSVGFRCASDPVAISQSFSSSSGRAAAGGNSVSIGSVSDGKLYQSVNVGDTATYNISAYVYNNTAGSVGGTVDTNVAQLYYGGNTISSPVWTPVSGETGWYKLTGTVTGVASGVDTGVLVKAGKTVIVDDISLSKEYNASGTLTSSIFDSEFAIGAAWGALSYTSSGSTVIVKARTSDDSGMSGATAFSSCTAISSGVDISSNNCVTDGQRYIQYEVTLSTSDTSVTPTFSDISIAFTTFDADAPSISLTALAPDPNGDTTPTLSGTATESAGTVSIVQFQMDSTSGSWSACTASDGSFNSSSEAFSCTAGTLTDGSHTMYVRATDSNGNTTASGSESSDTFSIDATVPISVNLESPGDNSYTNSERPSFKWKATTDATAGLSKYVLEIDNPSLGTDQPSGDFTIDNIPTSGTTDVVTNNKYVIHFDGFSDSDTTNNYISVYTKSHSDWGTSENDGKVKEGKVSWKVKAIDNATNETSSSRTLFVDYTRPNLEEIKVNNTVIPASSVIPAQAGIKTGSPIRSGMTQGTVGMSTTDHTPTITGKLTDPLAGEIAQGQTQSDSGPQVASGPKEVTVKLEKKQGVVYVLHTSYTINMDTSWWSCDGKEITDNSKNNCNKYSPFTYTVKDSLDLGTYRVTISGKDKANNISSETSFILNISTLSQLTTPEEREELEKEKGNPPSPDGSGEAKEELEVTKPVEQVPQSPLSVIPGLTGNLYKLMTSWIPTFVGMTRDVISFLFNTIGNTLAFFFNINTQVLSFIRSGIAQTVHTLTTTLSTVYNQLANSAPGVFRTFLLAVGDGVATISQWIQHTGNLIAQCSNTIFTAFRNTATSLAFGVGERVQDVSGTIGLGIIKFTYNFVPEPTTISNVKVARATATTMTITWTTNHPASSKVNYGLSADYGQDVQSTKKITNHELTVTGLKPATTYYYEVMSQNKNYVYDANHTFTTPAQ